MFVSLDVRTIAVRNIIYGGGEVRLLSDLGLDLMVSTMTIVGPATITAPFSSPKNT